ncbi:MAG: hypothetical protein LBS37_04295 [Treponema sp.]|jgi:hypothetical protein|nr:hypothetical protein [Treponema sp.]
MVTLSQEEKQTYPKAAAVSHRQAPDYTAKNKIPIAGHHLFYPAIGDAQAREGVRGYTFIPAR